MTNSTRVPNRFSDTYFSDTLITILTEPLSGKEKLLHSFKLFAKRLLGMRTFWPTSVVRSIELGLAENGETESINVNPPLGSFGKAVFVPTGVETLRYAISLKQNGSIKTIVAGPNISIPMDGKDIFFHPLIDKILVPSEWVKDYFLSLAPQENRIRVWAAGVPETPASPKKSQKILVYQKTCPENLLEKIKDTLKKNGIEYEIIRYGTFEKTEYLQKLDECMGMVYLQESESQGLALHEAWMKDIPTLVWSRGYWNNGGKSWQDESISAPYMTEECWMRFKDETDFEERLQSFWGQIRKFNPRAVQLQNFTNKATIRKLLEILSQD